MKLKASHYLAPRLPSAVDLTVKRYAVLEASGTPRRCNATGEERLGLKPRKGASKPKVVYATEEIAEAARLALEHLPGTRPLHSYECRRTRVPHYHLASVASRRSVGPSG
jgi:hypothetical protein